jgi:PPE-repeat protein
MTAPIWMAAPPEVHSTLLSSGPGPGPVLAAAGAWNSLSVEYASAADELSTLLAEVQAGAWEGPSAESYVAAHVPYLAWLMKASADSTAMATELETTAAAYTAALAAMPTLPELATNHVVHGTLLATNFFGINAIPIAVNEADYARMWVQAATTMGAYQAVSTAAVAAAPQADPAPTIVKADDAESGASGPPNQPPTDISGDNPLGLPQWLRNLLNQLGIGNELLAHDPTVDNALDQLIASFLHNFGISWNPAMGTVNGFTYDQYTNPLTLIFWVVRGLEKLEDFQQFFTYLAQNPIVAFQYLGSLILFDWPLHLIEELPFLPELLAPAALAAAAPLAPLGGLAGLAGLAAVPAPPALPVPAPIAPPAAPPIIPALGSTPMAAPGTAPTSAPAPSSAPTTSTAASPAPPPAPPTPAGPGFAPPYAVGPGLGLGSGMSSSASSSAKRKAPEPDSAAAAAAAAATAAGAARARRRQRGRMRGYGNEYMDMNVEVDPDWAGPPAAESPAATMASDQGAGNLGFTGTARREAAAGAAGLTTMVADEFGSGPRMPLLPGTWGAEDGKTDDTA